MIVKVPIKIGACNVYHWFPLVDAVESPLVVAGFTRTPAAGENRDEC